MKSFSRITLIAFTLLLVSCLAEPPADPTTPSPQAAGSVLPTVETTPTARLLPDPPTSQPTRTETPADPTDPSPSPEPSPSAAATSRPVNWPDGALIGLTLVGDVGVLLDEYPDPMREAVAAALREQDEAVWLQRATQQLELTYYRLHFRDYVYRKIGIPDKKQLPLPPRDLWSIALDPAGPRRETIDGHDLLMWSYTFTSTLLSDKNSPGRAEPRLEAIGGVWEEPFVLPADPSLILQRTGNACLNEAGFPPNSYDSENVATFFDYSCQADDGGLLGCHRTSLPTLSCETAMSSAIGRVNLVMRFERLPWNETLADSVRRGEVTRTGTPDLRVVEEELRNNRVVYRYFPADSCALQEACVGGPGWRRLLLFDATVHNIGTAGLDIGLVEAEDPTHNLFEYNACHNHLHYSHYGDFLLGSDENPSKRAFCVESTGRLSNNEFSPLTHDYSCRVQGIQSGWVDEYGAGLDCQWIDITDLKGEEIAADGTFSETLIFRSNTDRLLCEGTPILDEQGNRVWQFSGLYNNDGHPISYPACTLFDGFDRNNEGEASLLLSESGSFVTEPCRAGETGPRRNCGFTGEPESFSCEPGAPVRLSCRLPQQAAPQVLRLCEFSGRLGTGTACVWEDSLLNSPLNPRTTQVELTCPLPRSADEPGGAFSLYYTPLFSGDPGAPPTCQIVDA